MTAWVWKAVKVIVSLACGSVVVFGPSEVDTLAIGQVLPRAAAVAILAVIATTSMMAAVAPTSQQRMKACALRIGGFHLLAYGLVAGLLKGLVALPTAGLAVAIGLLFLDRAAAIAVHRTRTAHP